MKIAFVNIFRPREGSGDGITEYVYQLHKKLKNYHNVDFFFALEESKRVDIAGRIYAETFFRLATKKIARGNYDVVHIPNPEIGYFAKDLKKAGVKAKIVVTVHDFVRVISYSKGGRGGIQTLYDYVATKNTSSAIKYADYLIFTSTNELKYAKGKYNLPKYDLIPIGGKDLFLDTPIPKKGSKKTFFIGYMGGLVKSRHIDFILKVAEILGSAYQFRIYGIGEEKEALLKYKNDKNLSNVKFMGFAPEKQILKIYDSFDVFMSCSSIDVASLPIEDALARGIPVVVAKPNIYDEGLRKRIYEAKTPKDAAETIKKIRKNGYPQSRKKAILKYAKTLSWGNVAKKTESVYRKVTGGATD